MFSVNDDASTGIVDLMCAGHRFFTLDNLLLSMDTPHKPVIYLQFTALV